MLQQTNLQIQYKNLQYTSFHRTIDIQQYYFAAARAESLQMVSSKILGCNQKEASLGRQKQMKQEKQISTKLEKIQLNTKELGRMNKNLHRKNKQIWGQKQVYIPDPERARDQISRNRVKRGIFRILQKEYKKQMEVSSEKRHQSKCGDDKIHSSTSKEGFKQKENCEQKELQQQFDLSSEQSYIEKPEVIIRRQVREKEKIRRNIFQILDYQTKKLGIKPVKSEKCHDRNETQNIFANIDESQQKNSNNEQCNNENLQNMSFTLSISQYEEDSAIKSPQKIDEERQEKQWIERSILQIMQNQLTGMNRKRIQQIAQQKDEKQNMRRKIFELIQCELSGEEKKEQMVDNNKVQLEKNSTKQNQKEKERQNKLEEKMSSKQIENRIPNDKRKQKEKEKEIPWQKYKIRDKFAQQGKGQHKTGKKVDIEPNQMIEIKLANQNENKGEVENITKENEKMNKIKPTYNSVPVQSQSNENYKQNQRYCDSESRYDSNGPNKAQVSAASYAFKPSYARTMDESEPKTKTASKKYSISTQKYTPLLKNQKEENEQEIESLFPVSRRNRLPFGQKAQVLKAKIQSLSKCNIEKETKKYQLLNLPNKSLFSPKQEKPQKVSPNKSNIYARSPIKKHSQINSKTQALPKLDNEQGEYMQFPTRVNSKSYEDYLVKSMKKPYFFNKRHEFSPIRASKRSRTQNVQRESSPEQNQMSPNVTYRYKKSNTPELLSSQDQLYEEKQLKTQPSEHVLESIKINPQILQKSLSHLTKRQKFEYLKRAAKEVRQDHFSNSLKHKLYTIKNKNNLTQSLKYQSIVKPLFPYMV